MTRPRVILNCAVSANGCLAAADGSPLQFSGPEDWKRVHGLRAACDGILVGAETIRRDDPSLRVKPEHADGDDPVRIVLCGTGELPPGSRIFDGTAPSVIVTGKGAPTIMSAQQIRVNTSKGLADAGEVLEALAMRGMRSILVEGGATVLRAFLAADTWDELTVFVASVNVDGDAPRLWTTGPDELGLRWSEEPLGAGRLLRFSRE